MSLCGFLDLVISRVLKQGTEFALGIFIVRKLLVWGAGARCTVKFENDSYM